MKFFALVSVAIAAVHQNLVQRHEQKQDPCADCEEYRAIRYQVCASKYGDPCKKNDKGETADITCCTHKTKHERCLECSARDCEHGTCTVNKKYYNFHHKEKEDKDFDKRQMNKHGWGVQWEDSALSEKQEEREHAKSELPFHWYAFLYLLYWLKKWVKDKKRDLMILIWCAPIFVFSLSKHTTNKI